MDSLTQIVLGGAVAAACVPPTQRRRALVAGAVLGTLPDLDVAVLALFDLDPIGHMTWHRGPSHSLFVLAALGACLAWLARQRADAVRAAPWAWFAAIELALLTHPLLDAFTVYGTQLFWPLPLPPVMISSVFIIDPLYTLPLLFAFVAGLWSGARPAARTALFAGLALSTAYLGWSLVAKALVERSAATELAARGLADAPRFSVPMPFNTLLWRMVVMTPDGHLEGTRSLVADEGPIEFKHYPSDQRALAAVRPLSAPLRRLEWFARGFLKAEAVDGRLVVSDLRMGDEPDYTFRFVVASERDGRWTAIRPEQLDWPWQARSRLAAMWQRIWNAPPPTPPR
ncbi:MAG: metal-dependent hydrolase [Xanthomonadales bacterium]|nr:metal-dependent hydrolase [Xanthomonadales bacterium]